MITTSYARAMGKKSAFSKARQQQARVARARTLIQKLKDSPCVDCGETYPYYVMQFDHVRGDKIRHVSKMVLFSPDTILAEIAKCDLVCANCHAVRTFLRRGPDTLTYNGETISDAQL